MHDDGRRKAEDHHVRPLHPARVHGVAGVGQAGEEALDGPGEAVQGYLDPPGLLLDAQREPGRELMDHSLEDSKIISTADDPAMEEVRREARGGGGAPHRCQQYQRGGALLENSKQSACPDPTRTEFSSSGRV